MYYRSKFLPTEWECLTIYLEVSRPIIKVGIIYLL